MTNAAAVNRVLLVSDTPARATSGDIKLRRYRLARARLSPVTSVRDTPVRRKRI